MLRPHAQLALFTAISMSALAAALLQGFGLGASLIIAIGAQNAFVLRQGLERRHVFATAAVCTSCDMTLIALGVGGMGALIARQPALAAAATWGGALFLLIYGLRSFRSALTPGALSADAAAHPPSLGGTLLAALAFSLLNPHVYLDTVVLLGSVGARFPAGQRAGFAAGAMLASTVWFFGLAYGAAKLAPLFRRPAAWRVLDLAVGFTMWVIAASLIGVAIWPALAVLLILAVLIALAGMVYQALGSMRDTRRLPPPGELAAVNGRRMHIEARGEGNPAVVLEAGIASTSVSWSLVEPHVARFAQVCSYDRAGLGWSDAAAGAFTSEQMLDDLRELLRAADVPAPYVLVGHSFGALLVRLFAARYPGEVAGLVLVDPVSIQEWAPLSPAQQQRLWRGVKLARRGALLARFGVVRFALALLVRKRSRIPRWLARISAGQGASVTHRLTAEVSKLPPEKWPAVIAHWSRPASFEAMARYLESLPVCAEEMRKANPAQPVPLILLTAGEPTEAQRREHDALVRLSPEGRHIAVPSSGHWIQLDAPERVVEAIRDAVERARR